MHRIGCVIPNMIQLFVRSKTFDTPCLWSKLNVEITKRVECILFLLLYYILCRPTAVFHFGFGLTKQCLGGLLCMMLHLANNILVQLRIIIFFSKMASSKLFLVYILYIYKPNA